MATILASGEISKAYADWKAVFNAHEAVRTAAGIEVIYVAHELDNERKLHVLQRM